MCEGLLEFFACAHSSEVLISYFANAEIALLEEKISYQPNLRIQLFGFCECTLTELLAAFPQGLVVHQAPQYTSGASYLWPPAAYPSDASIALESM